MAKVAAVSLVIETKDTAKRLAEIDFELDSIGKKLREAKKAGQADVYAGLKQQQAALRTEAREVNKALRDQSLAFLQAAKSIPKDSLTGLTTQYRELRRQIDLLSESQRKSDFGQRLISQAKNVKTQIDNIGASVGDFRSNVGNYRGALNDFFSASNLLGGNVSAIFSGISKAGLAGVIVGGAAQATAALFELNKTISALQAGVQKTTGLTEAQVDSLTESLKELDTVTTIEDLLKIAEIAGRLGVQGEKGVLQFTQAIEKLSIALGDEFTGGAEQITDEVGRLSNVFFGATQDGEVLADNVLSIGNALNVLAANGASTAPVITDFSTRIGGLGIPLGVTAGEILGISATLQELNVSAERGGTAVGRIFQELTQAPEAFAKELGITKKTLQDAGFQVGSFTDLVNTDLVGALQFAGTRILELNGNNTELADTLKNLKINGSGELEVLLKLAQGNERLSQNINLANKSLLSQDSLTNEVKTRQENLSGVTERLSNNFRELFVSSGLEEGFTNVVSGANDAVVAFGNLGKAFQEARKESETFNTTTKVGVGLIASIPGALILAGNAFRNFGKAIGAFFNSEGVDSFSQRFEKFFNVILTGSAKTNEQLQADRRAIVQIGDEAQASLEKLSGLKISTPVAELTAQLNKLKTEFILNPFSKTLEKQIIDTENKIAKERSKLQAQAAETATKELKNISDTIDTISKTSIAGMEAALASLREKAEQAPNATVFARLTNEADALQLKIDQTRAKFERLVDAQRGITAVVNVLPTLTEDPFAGVQAISTELGLEEDARIENEKEVLDTIARLNKVNRELIGQQRQEAFEVQLARDEANLEAEKQVYENFYTGIGDSLAAFTESTLEGQQDAFKEFSKGIVITALEAVEKLIQLQLAQAFGISLAQPDSIATLGASGLIKFAIVSGLIKGFFAAIKSQVSNFDQGGQIPSITGSRVTDAQNIPTQPGGDNVLAMVRQGEVVLNDGQQRRLFEYAGPDVFRRIGVPGFQSGGAIGGTPQILNPNVSVSAPGAAQSGVDEATFQKFAALIGSEVARQVGPAVEAGFMSAEEKNYRRRQLKNDTTI